MQRRLAPFAPLLMALFGCAPGAMPPDPREPSGPEDQIPLFTDTRLNGSWRVTVADPGSSPLLGFLDDSCLDIFALAALSLEVDCQEEVLWGSFPATSPAEGLAELAMFVVVDDVRQEVVLSLRIEDGSLAIGTVRVTVPGSGLSASGSITLRLR